MTRISGAALGLTLAAMFAGCAVGQPRGYVDATAWSANYTEEYIHEFHILTASGTDTGLEGIQVKEFSKGGAGGHECCSLIPGVGQTIKVVWKIGAYNDKEPQWKTYSKDVKVTGLTSNDPEWFNFVIVRFFPNHEVEAEFVSESSKFDGEPSPRVDQVFYGRRVMRQKGE